MITLREYQGSGVELIRADLYAGCRFVLYVLPTGCWKLLDVIKAVVAQAGEVGNA